MKTLSYVAPINDLGYGVVSTNILSSIVKQVEVSLFPLGPIDCSVHHVESVKKALKNAETYDLFAPCVRLYHQNSLAEFVGKGKHVGFPIFELDGFDVAERTHLGSCDELFVCSEWAREVLKQNGLNVPCHVVPCGVDRNIFRDTNNTIRGKFIIFSAGKYEYRKGHDVLPEVVRLAFDRGSGIPKDVELWVAFDNPFYDSPGRPTNKEWKDRYKSILGNNVKFIPRLHSQQELASLMNMSSAGIFLSRAEGWNLEALEMMSCGKPIIITNYSAHTEFCNNDNSFLIDIDEKEVADDGFWFNGEKGNWAKIGKNQVEQAVEHLRTLYKERCVNEEGIKTAQKYSWENSAQQLLRKL